MNWLPLAACSPPACDLADLSAGRPVLGKTAYRERIKRLMRSQAAQTVAKQYFKNLLSNPKRVLKERGGAISG